ncbi:11656_t:CDS:1 [Gigaspora margarita]|uniref:11656_t:CDS:1 n=1 Tax=Gigaspora margarita TaxID=4874 RepID=A0ABN7V0N6_GIGMA|nr:11656_t:CDS:1 [Gigaspora margarita]
MNSIGGDFDKWTRSKEYRGYIHIPSFNVKCDASGNLVTANPRDPDYRNKENPTKSPDQVDDAERNPYGYTKIPLYARIKCTNEYEPADVYTEDLTFIGFQSKPKSFNNRDTCLNILDFRTSRLSNCSRYAQQELTGTDAPFIFTNVNMKVCCNRQVSITIDRSVFPQTRLYIDGKMVGEQEQTDLGQFILSGGRQPDPSKLSKVGHGKIARSGKSLTYNKKVEKVIPA